MKTPYANKPAFTIVELLIVIVVIGILATISIIAYNGITQKAKNTAIINAASQSLRMIEAYIAVKGAYPSKGSACITVDSGCQTDLTSDSTVSSSPTFNTNMATVGILPRGVPVQDARWYGVTYSYSDGTTFDGISQPAVLRYYLLGKEQQCGIPMVMKRTGVTGVLVTSTDGFTSYNAGSNKTECVVSIPGPAHS